jgi:hypothetical protein
LFYQELYVKYGLKIGVCGLEFILAPLTLTLSRQGRGENPPLCRKGEVWGEDFGATRIYLM